MRTVGISFGLHVAYRLFKQDLDPLVELGVLLLDLVSIGIDLLELLRELRQAL